MGKATVCIDNLTIRIERERGQDVPCNALSGFFAEIAPEKQDHEVKMMDAHQWKEDITIRTSFLDVSGFISKIFYEGSTKKYLLQVTDLVSRKSDLNTLEPIA